MKIFNRKAKALKAKVIKYKPNGIRDFGRPIVRIVLHCTATSPEATIEAIKAYWKNNLGWENPGYHYIIDREGRRHILVNSLSQVTNGVKGYNWNSVHIAYIGGKYEDDRTPAQKEAMLKLIQELRAPNVLGPVEVVGHRDLSPDKNGNGIIEKWEWVKRCPSFEVSDWIKIVNI